MPNYCNEPWAPARLMGAVEVSLADQYSCL
mgnify:CR=1 FL=1